MPATKEFSRFEDWTVAPGLRDSHQLILNKVDGILRNEEGPRFLCRFSSMSAWIVNTGSKRWCTGSRRRSVRSVRARSWLHNSRPSPFRARAALARRALRPVAHAETPVVREPAAVGTSTKSPHPSAITQLLFSATRLKARSTLSAPPSLRCTIQPLHDFRICRHFGDLLLNRRRSAYSDDPGD